MKRLFRRLFAIMIIFPCIFMFTGCDNKPVSIVDIEKTASSGIVDTYTIKYSNNTTSEFTIVNGQDGEDLYTNVTLVDLYNEIKKTKGDSYSMVDFINEYLDIKVETNAISSSIGLRSAVSVFVEHEVTIPDYNNVKEYVQNVYGTQITYGVKNSIVWGAGAGVIYQLDNSTGDAYIITNYHVCFSNNDSVIASDGIATKITCYAYGSESISLQDLANLSYYNQNCKTYGDLFEYDNEGLPIVDYGYGAIEAQYVGGSEQYDIAVLKVTNSEVLKNSTIAQAVEVADSNDVAPGATAIAIGNPDAYGISVTQGSVSVDSEFIQVVIDNTSVALREFRIDTPVNSGNSGGGLFDSYGRLIGIVNAKTNDASTENMSYAIPSNVATRMADRIIASCDGITRNTKRILVGIGLGVNNSMAYYDPESAVIRVEEDVEIVQIEGDSLATELGLKIGDIIDSVDIIRGENIVHKDIDRTFTLVDMMLLVNEGDCLKFNYTRDGVSGSVTSTQLTQEYFITIK